MLRKLLVTICILIVATLAAGYLLLFPPFPRPPEIGRGLPGNFAEADREFRQKVLSAFPLPMPESELVAALRSQGFNVNSEGGRAMFEKQRFPCMLIWRINWKAEDGVVTELSAKYGGSCL